MTTTVPARSAPATRPARRGGVRALLVGTVVALTAAGALPAAAAPAPRVAAPAAAAAAASSADTLGTGATLAAGQVLTSANGQYRAAMQLDGNFVVYGPKGPLWWTGTNKGASSFVAMQTDGNLVVYSGGAGSRSLWATYSAGAAARLVIQDDGNLVIYSGQRPLWSRLTGNFRYDILAPSAVLLPGYGLISQNARYTAAMQEDGNFVIYGPGNRVLYQTGTSGSPGTYLVMERTGQPFLYNRGAKIGSFGAPESIGAFMIMQNDGNLVIYSDSPDGRDVGRPTWWTGTHS